MGEKGARGHLQVGGAQGNREVRPQGEAWETVRTAGAGVRLELERSQGAGSQGPAGGQDPHPPRTHTEQLPRLTHWDLGVVLPLRNDRAVGVVRTSRRGRQRGRRAHPALRCKRPVPWTSAPACLPPSEEETAGPCPSPGGVHTVTPSPMWPVWMLPDTGPLLPQHPTLQPSDHRASGPSGLRTERPPLGGTPEQRWPQVPASRDLRGVKALCTHDPLKAKALISSSHLPKLDIILRVLCVLVQRNPQPHCDGCTVPPI